MDEENDVLIFTIKDNGSGISPEILPKIFDQFFTTKAEKGIGLGLSMVKNIIEKEFMGEVGVESKVGEYTEFTISIPFEIDLKR